MRCKVRLFKVEIHLISYILSTIIIVWRALCGRIMLSTTTKKCQVLRDNEILTCHLGDVCAVIVWIFTERMHTIVTRSRVRACFFFIYLISFVYLNNKKKKFLNTTTIWEGRKNALLTYRAFAWNVCVHSSRRIWNAIIFILWFGTLSQ